jgi:hypothetical protein
VARLAFFLGGLALFLGSGVSSGCSGGGVASGSTAAGGGGQSATAGGSSSAGGAGAGGAAGAGATSGSSGGATGGTSSTGGSATGGTGGTGGSGGQSTGPAGIDYSIWSLQLPSGSGNSPTTISPSELLKGYSDAYFYPAADGGQIFMDPATGITTSGSAHCRTEMREMTPAGKPAAWAPSGTNTLTVSGKVLQVGGGSSGKVTVGQVFNGTDSIPLCELEYSTSKGGFQLLYEEAKGAGTTVDLMTPVALDAEYTFTLSLSGNTLAVSIDGAAVYTHTPSAAVLAKQFYFKFGNYDQTAKAGAVSTVPYTVVEVHGAEVVHQ